MVTWIHLWWWSHISSHIERDIEWGRSLMEQIKHTNCKSHLHKNTLYLFWLETCVYIHTFCVIYTNLVWWEGIVNQDLQITNHIYTNHKNICHILNTHVLLIACFGKILQIYLAQCKNLCGDRNVSCYCFGLLHNRFEQIYANVMCKYDMQYVFSICSS